MCAQMSLKCVTKIYWRPEQFSIHERNVNVNIFQYIRSLNAMSKTDLNSFTRRKHNNEANYLIYENVTKGNLQVHQQEPTRTDANSKKFHQLHENKSIT